MSGEGIGATEKGGGADGEMGEKQRVAKRGIQIAERR
jgi:hypothetical protein